VFGSGIDAGLPDGKISLMKEKALKVTLTEPEIAGSYVVTERRADGALVLMPERERLSDVIAETAGQVHDDQEFIAHLERVARAEDDLSSDEDAECAPSN